MVRENEEGVRGSTRRLILRFARGQFAMRRSNHVELMRLPVFTAYSVKVPISVKLCTRRALISSWISSQAWVFGLAGPTRVTKRLTAASSSGRSCSIVARMMTWLVSK